MKVFKKKQVVLVALVAMVAVAGYLNWSYTGEDRGMVADSADNALGQARLVSGTNIQDAGASPTPTLASDEDYFAASRLERETGRGKAIETLNALIADENTSAESKQSAETQILDIAKRTEQEASIEAQLKAKGFADAVVYINGDTASVIVKAEAGITSQDAAKIQETVVQIAGVSSENVKIIERK